MQFTVDSYKDYASPYFYNVYYYNCNICGSIHKLTKPMKHKHLAANGLSKYCKNNYKHYNVFSL